MKKVLALVLLCACDSGVGCDSRHMATPAPEAEANRPAEPTTPAEPEALPEGIEPPTASTTRSAATPTKTTPTKTTPTKTTPAKTANTSYGKASNTSSSPKASSSPAGSGSSGSTQAPEPAPTPVAPTPPKASVLPQTAHVRFEVSSDLHKLIDADGRMVGWLKRVLPVIDGCYRSSASGKSGTVKVGLTLHENRRPSTAIQSLPGSLASLVPCATTKLMNQRPPLFTGPEGARHTVGIRFTP